jgi:hypothetical protein
MNSGTTFDASINSATAAARSGTTFDCSFRCAAPVAERCDSSSRSAGTAFDELRDHLANCELQIANAESLRVLRALCGKKTLPRPPRPLR